MVTSSRKRRRKSTTRKKQPPITVRAIDFVMYCTRNMRSTRGFYQKLFGLGKGPEWNDSWSEFDTLPVTLCLNGPSGKPEWDWEGGAAVALAVPDIYAAMEACRRHKVRVLAEPVESRVCWMALIADPSGNRICLHQRKDGTAG
jgi:predicted enzyme related to lactoylglutathione lyase